MTKLGKICALAALILGLAVPAMAGPQMTFGPEDKGMLQIDYKGQFQMTVRDIGSGDNNDDTTTNFNFNVQAGDSSNYYDWGIYGPFTGVETTLPLLCNIGGQKFNATGSITVAWLTPVTLQPGYYFLAITSDGAPPGLQIYADPSISWLYGSLVVTPSTGTGAALALPANITVQTISPVAQTSGAGSNKPQNIVFNLF